MPAGERDYATRGAAEDPGREFAGIIGELTVAVGQLRERMSGEARPKIPWNACHPVWFTGAIPLTAGAGTLGATQDNYGPTTPYWWDLRSLKAWGFTAGTVTVYRGPSAAGEQLAVFSAPGEFTWSAQNFLAPEDDLLWSASGITGSVFITGQAVELEAAWLPEYLM